MSELYKQSGVDIQKADELTQKIKEKTKSSNIGRFSAVVPIAELGELSLVTTVDGIGTKIIPLLERNDYATIANDLIAMNLNDLVCSGARAVSFSDYIALNSIDPEIVSEIVKELAVQLQIYDCPLTSGETSEMKVLIPKNKLDIAGFAVGIAKTKKLLPASNIQKGDFIIGLKSNGIHSNGFSLIRKLFEDKKLTLEEFEICLRPTTVYYNEVLDLCKSELIKSCANITGGGLFHNLARALPENKYNIDVNKIPKQPIFQKLYNICGKEAYEVFNMGVGFCVICSHENVENVMNKLKKYSPFILGEVV